MNKSELINELSEETTFSKMDVTRVLDSISNGQLVQYSRTINRYTFQDGKLPTLANFSFSASAELFEIAPAIFL